MKRGVYMMSMFEDKFHLSPEQSLFLAKKKWDENVYCGMKMENRSDRANGEYQTGTAGQNDAHELFEDQRSPRHAQPDRGPEGFLQLVFERGPQRGVWRRFFHHRLHGQPGAGVYRLPPG